MAETAKGSIGPSREMDAVDYLMHRGEANPRTRSAFLGVEILDRGVDFERLREIYERTTRAVVRMRQKVVVPALPTAAPRWVVDPDFDLGYHLRRVRIPEPGTHRQVLDLAELILRSPLDPGRPLWTVTLVEGLEGGRSALLAHTSHAVTDGMGGVAMMRELYDLERDAPRRPMPPLPVPEDLSPTDLARTGMSGLPRSAVSGTRSLLGGAVGALGRLVRSPVQTVTDTIEFTRSIGRVLGPPPVEPSPLMRRRSLSSRTETVDVPLDDLRRASKAAGGSINDAYLAALSGALRLYHEELGVPVEAVPMAVPVSLRTEDDPVGGNRFAGVTLAAPLSETDPAERMRLIREQIVTGREERAVDLLGRLAPLLTLLPAPLLEVVAGSMTPPDVQASNVPGYQQDTFIAGAKVQRQYGLGPLPGVAMMVVFVSRAGACTVAARYDTASITDDELFARCLREGFAEVLALGHEAPAPPDGAAKPAVDRRRPATAGRRRARPAATR